MKRLYAHEDKLCENVNVAKSLYQSVWNSALSCKDPNVALKLQQKSLGLLIASDPSSHLEKFVSFACLSAANFASKCQAISPDDIPNKASSEKSTATNSNSPVMSRAAVDAKVLDFYHQLLSSSLNHIKKSAMKLTSADVVQLLTLLQSCDIHVHSRLFKYFLRMMESVCGTVCYTAVYYGLQVLRSALASRPGDFSELRRCMSDMNKCRAVIEVDLEAGKVALQCLFYTLEKMRTASSKDNLVSLMHVYEMKDRFFQ